LAVLVLRARQRTVPLTTAIAVALLASVVATAPFTAWAIVRNARVSRDLSAFAADRFGPENDGIDTSVIDRAARRIPKGATYAIVFAPRLNAAVGAAFKVWAEAVLLPRVQVTDLGRASWVITFGASPRRLGVQARAVTVVSSSRGPRLDAWVGRLR
jgi:hypothetical protein